MLRRRGIKMRPSGPVRVKGVLPPKMCVDCGAGPLPNRRWDRCEACVKPHLQAIENRLMRECRDRMKTDKKCPQCYQPNDGEFILCPSCLADNRERRRSAKRKCIEAYGGCCECCGEKESDFLTVDHVNNDGGERRKNKVYGNSGTGEQLYRWLARHGFPKTHRILCMNCNWGRRLNGICPHKKIT